MARFKLLHGRHIARYELTDEKGNVLKDSYGNPKIEEVTHIASSPSNPSDNDVVESDEDLVKKHPNKFKKISD